MVKTLSAVVAALVIVLLSAGYLASQYAAMHGLYANYAEKVDAFPVRLLALVILTASVASGFLRKSEDE